MVADGPDPAIAKRMLNQLKLNGFVFQRIAVGWSALADSRGKGSWQAGTVRPGVHTFGALSSGSRGRWGSSTPALQYTPCQPCRDQIAPTAPRDRLTLSQWEYGW